MIGRAGLGIAGRYPTGIDERQRWIWMRRFTLLDLVAATTLVAVHFTIANLSVALREYGAIYVALAFPTLLTAMVHWRFNLSWRTATIAHYPIAVAWAFLFGVTFSFYWRRLPHDFFDRQTVGLEYPIGFGILAAEAMLFIAVVSTVAYGCVAYRLTTMVPRNRG